MKYKFAKFYFKTLLILIFIFVFIPILIGGIFVTLVAHDFTDISYYSPLKYLVDKEIRDLPIIRAGSHVSYRAAPSDGNAFVLSSVTLDVDDKEKYYQQSIEYFVGLGYIKVGDCNFLQDEKINGCALNRVIYGNEDDITINLEDNTIQVTKLTFY